MNQLPDRILVIDDDPDIGLMIKTMLEYHGYAVEVKDKADRAAEWVGSGDYGLLIMDMLLSGVNGIDVCSALKQDPKLAHVPVIMISAHPNAKGICQEAGAEDFISKPFDMQDILGKISQFVSPVNGSRL
jgi:DNA-binding response OmpR family regulator